jgi:glycosyltransferase involved in cell wall biosynthesis
MKKIAIVGSNPNFLGGITNYINNFVNRLDKNKFEVTWFYVGEINKNYKKYGINFVEIKTTKKLFFQDLDFNIKIKKRLEKEKFDVINSHAIWGHWMKNFKNLNNSLLVHTYHGVSYYFYKNHSQKNKIKRILLQPLLFLSYFMEKPPIYQAKRIICVSEKVKRDIEKLYLKRKEVYTLRTGADTKKFKPRDKNICKKLLKLSNKNIYGLYVGRGGYWTKGLDRVINLSEEMYKINKKYRLIIGGAEQNKVKKLLNKPFIIYKPIISRKEMPFYYNSSDFFFCLSRYEGGAPTLVTGEAMASGCLVVCSKDSEQEVIMDRKNGVVIDCEKKDFSSDARRILSISKTQKKEIVKNGLKTIKELSRVWWKKYAQCLGI